KSLESLKKPVESLAPQNGIFEIPLKSMKDVKCVTAGIHRFRRFSQIDNHETNEPHEKEQSAIDGAISCRSYVSWFLRVSSSCFVSLSYCNCVLGRQLDATPPAPPC